MVIQPGSRWHQEDRKEMVRNQNEKIKETDVSSTGQYKIETML
jgi:hypothetical protein